MLEWFDMRFDARLLRISDWSENDWVRGIGLFVAVMLLEALVGFFLMEGISASLEAQRKQEFAASWGEFLKQRQQVHESKVTGYAWWGELSLAVIGGDRAFINDNILEDASLSTEYDLVWLADGSGRTLYAALDGEVSGAADSELEAGRDIETDREFLEFTRAEWERVRGMPAAERPALERPVVDHQMREYAGALRLVTVSPLCDLHGYTMGPGYFVLGYKFEGIMREAEKVIPVQLKLERERPSRAYYVEPIKAGEREFYLIFEPNQSIASLLRNSLVALMAIQVLLVMVTGLFAVPYFARRRGRRLQAAVNERTREMQAARRQAEVEKEAAELSRRELAQLNEISRQINSTRNLDEILDQVFEYFLGEFGIEAGIVLLTDSERKELYSYKTTSPPNATEEMIAYSRRMRVDLQTDGMLQRTYARKRPFYLSKVDDRAFPEGSDREIVDTLHLKSFLLVPLLIREEVIAMILFTSYDKKLRLSRTEIDRITRFCHQIAGAIYHASLLRQVEEERARSDAALRDAEIARAEIAQINEISRRINSTVDLNQVLDGILRYFIENYNIGDLWLQLVDEKHGELFTYRVLSHETPEEVVDYLYNLRQPLDKSAGLNYQTYARGKPVYLSRVPKRYRSEEDRRIVESLQLKSVLQIPLLLHDRVMGILHANSYQQQMFLEPEHIETINRFAQQIAGAVHTARLYEQAEIARIATEVQRTNAERAQKKADNLLLNILPEKIATELKDKGEVAPLEYESVTVMFTDFVGFTRIAEQLPPDELIRELDGCFSQFDDVSHRNGLEKLKTIGDAYMCAGGLPDPNHTHAIDACMAALEFQSFMDQMRDIKSSMGLDFWELRVGIHTGPLTAGVVGKKKFAYDIWGDTVNTASRMESHGAPSRVNVSGATYEKVRYFFTCEPRGKVQAKGKGMVDMYFLTGIHPHLSRDGEGLIPNDEFRALYEKLRGGAKLRYRSEVDSN